MLGFTPLASSPLADDGQVAGGGVVVFVTGVAGTGQVGTVTVVLSQDVSVTGVAATGNVGSVSVVGSATASITGVAGTGNVGSVTVDTPTVSDVNVTVTGVSASGEVSTVKENLFFGITGTTSTGSVSQTKVNTKEKLTGVEGQFTSPSLQLVVNFTRVLNGTEAVTALTKPKVNVQEVVTSTALSSSIATVKTNVSVPIIPSGLEGTVQRTTQTAVIFNFESVKTLYSRRRTVIIPKAA